MIKEELNDKEVELKDALIKREINNIKIDCEKTILSKISELHYLINAITIDSEKTILGSEPILKNTYNEDEVLVLKNKLFSLIKQL